MAWVAPAIGAASSLLGSSKSTPAGPSNAEAIFGSSMFSEDHSGWNVSIGGGNIASAASKKTDQGAGQDSASSLLPDGYLPYALIFVAGVVLWRLVAK